MEDLRKSKHGIIRSKGAQQICPRDGKLGAAYVDSMKGEDFVGSANVMLSYCWSYRIKDIVKTLEEKCEADERDPSGPMSGSIAYATTCTVLMKMFPLSNSVIFLAQLLLASGLCGP